MSLDGAQLGRTDAHTRTYTVLGLQAGTQATVSVKAFDAAGNMSETGPRVTFDTGDDTPPVWPETPSIRASQITDQSVMLAWTPATDDVAVSAYVMTQNGQIIGEAAQPQFAVNRLAPWTDYTFTVRARDALEMSRPMTVDVQTIDTVEPGWQVGEQLSAEM